MQTDEYEISITRERNHCRQVVKSIHTDLAGRQEKYGMMYEAAATAAAAGTLDISTRELAKWQDDVEALPQWEQRLQEYQVALAAMRISAS